MASDSNVIAKTVERCLACEAVVNRETPSDMPLSCLRSVSR
jgi:hypothetical protein